MISRRNIRVKVMQSLYALRTGNDMTGVVKQAATAVTSFTPGQALPVGKAQRILERQFNQTLGLFTYQIWFLTEVARYAETDARNRASKHLPTQDDLNVPVKIAGNELLWRILESGFYKEGLEKHKPHLLNVGDWIRNIYVKLTETDSYALYNLQPGRDKKAEREILEFIYNNLMLANEDWVAFTEDLFNNWDDDAEMLQQLVMNYLQKPGVWKMSEMLGADKFNFALQLLETTHERAPQIDELIKPKLRNWDAERLAMLDVILLQMGVCEFLYFETIPPKVTINEYIDLAKAYSTNQSGQFINGILDNIRKVLEKENRLHKVS
ncbi:MAG TPA: transcription antitermination factor NusB, partial [Phnomibacter sp.]|nr:transcription antitermination factor NusB [Phnomibacter sp.]